MSLLARIAMVIVMSVFSFGIAILWITAFLGEYEMLFDTMELPLDTPAPPVWSLWLGEVMMLVPLTALGAAFWAMHRIIAQAGKDEVFVTMADQLHRCAVAFVVFWCGNIAVVTLLPVALLSQIPYADWPEWELFPIDLDVVFLVLAVAFFAIANALRRAQEVADENRQFI